MFHWRFVQIARRAQEELEKELRERAAEQDRLDAELARKLAEEDRQTVGSQEAQRQRQLAEDEKVSKKLAVANMRADHRRQKFLQLVVGEGNDNNSAAGGGSAASANRKVMSAVDYWRDAEPIVEDVMNGICITLLLPEIQTIEVNTLIKTTIRRRWKKR